MIGFIGSGMKKWTFLAIIFFWIISAYFAPIIAQASSSESLKKSTDQISELHTYFNKTASKDPSNKGANKLSTATQNLLAGLKAYKLDEMDESALNELLQKTLTECRKYKTPNAQKLEAEIKQIQDALAQANHQTTSEAPTTRRKKLNKEDFNKREAGESNSPENEPKITFSEEESPVNSFRNRTPSKESSAESPTVVKQENDSSSIIESSNKSTAVSPIVYVLFAVLMVVMVFFGYFLYNTQLRQMQTLSDRIKFLEDELKAFYEKDPGVQGMDGATFMAVAEVKKKTENLERNMVDFLQLTEERIGAIERRAETLSGLLPIEAAVLQTDHQKMTALEQKLTAIEQKITPSEASNAPQAVKITQKYDVHLVDQLIDSIGQLGSHTDIASLKTVCNDLNILFKLSVAKRSWEDIDPYALATLLQLAYVSAFNEQLDDLYHALADHAKLLGISIEDKATNKKAFDVQMAENIPYENYLSNPKVKNEEYPNFKAINQQIERKFNLSETRSGTILSVLQPGIMLTLEGNKTVVLQKGKYVIKS